MGGLSRAGVALLLIAAVPSAAAVAPPPSVQSGVEAWRVGDYAAAVAIWRPFAQAGDPDALFNLGQAYKLGRGVPKDLAQARNYYRQAANRGNLPGQANLGILLFQAGEKPEAIRWLRQAADRGELRAQYVLGVALYNGDGAPRSIPAGYAYLLRARAGGLPQATEMLRSIEPLLSPADRARGEALAATLAAGGGLPAASIGSPPAGPPPKVQPDYVAADGATAPKTTGKAGGKATDEAGARRPAGAPEAATEAAMNSAQAQPAPKPAGSGQVMAAAAKPAAGAPDAKTPEPRPAESDRVGASAASASSPEAGRSDSARPATAKPDAKRPEAKKSDAGSPDAKKPEARPTGWRVQLGAFSTRAQAEASWKGIKAKDRAAAGGKPAIFDASGSIVKLQIGPYPDKAAARAACDALSAAGKACFVTKE